MAKQLKKPKYFIAVNGKLHHSTSNEKEHFTELETLKKSMVNHITTSYVANRQSFVHSKKPFEKNYRVQGVDYVAFEVASEPEPQAKEETENQSL